MSSVSVRQLVSPTDAERSRMVELFGIAMAQDSSIACITGGHKEGERYLFRQWIDAALDVGEVWVAEVDQRIEGAALWISPGKDVTVTGQERYLRLLHAETQEWLVQHFRPKYDQLYRQAYPLRELTRLHSWHMKLISVNPRLHRRGIGTALVSAVRERADRYSQAMTVDVPTASALYFFQSLGFSYRAVKNFSSRRGGFPLWAMLREPRHAKPT